MKRKKRNWFAYFIGFVVCFLMRLIPFRPPNVEPILTTVMPFSRVYGKLAGFSFGFFSIVLYDIFTGKIGIWTLITAVTYGLLAFWAIVYFKNKKNDKWSYVKFAIFGTIVFDAVTGLSVGPLFFNQPFSVALAGQIPFTLMHLIGNISFAFILSPAIYTLLIKEHNFGKASIIKVFNLKKA